jgi:hypothetical protein
VVSGWGSFINIWQLSGRRRRMPKKGKKQKQRMRNELRTLHSHIDEEGRQFGYPHPMMDGHKKESTKVAHDRTVNKMFTDIEKGRKS